MKKDQCSISNQVLIGILSIIAIVLLGWSAYLYQLQNTLNQQLKDDATISSEQDSDTEVSNDDLKEEEVLKTYNNNILNASFQYPESFDIEEKQIMDFGEQGIWCGNRNSR